MNKDTLKKHYFKAKRALGGKRVSRDAFLAITGVSKLRYLAFFDNFGDFRAYCENDPEPVQDMSDEELGGGFQAKHDVNGGSSCATLNDDKIRSLDDLVRECSIDLNEWAITKHIINKWGNPDNLNFQVKAWLQRRSPVTTENVLDFIREQVESPSQPIKLKQKSGGKYSYVLNIHDLHLAKLALSSETGWGDWNNDIAIRAYKEAVVELLAEIEDVQDNLLEIVLVVGSDFMHIDNKRSSTTSGTFVDSQGSFMESFKSGCDLLVSVIDALSAVAPVKAVVIPGNHDHDVSKFVGAYLSAWYRNNALIEIDGESTSRKYHTFGKNLLAFTHGKDEKLTDLPLVVFRENQSIISDIKWVEVLTGHLHQESVKEMQGVKIRIAPALCSPDYWHSSKGYVGGLQQAQGLLYDIDRGLRRITHTTPLNA